MAYASLYRKYRPSSFDEVIGQDSVVRTLRNMVKHDSIAHAYLFTGTRGTGKTSVARIFAKAVNCTDPRDGSPCCQCAACRAFDGAAGVDFVEMDAASNNSIDDIRDLRDAVKYPPASGELRYKVYIIDEVHQLSTQAFNGFLKTLEEPPSYCIFILATTEVQKLPQTILSRCLRFDFALVSQEELAAHVGRIYEREGATFSQDAVMAIAAAGQGSVRDTLSVADTCLTASDGNVTYERVLEVLGSNDPALIADTAQSILSGNLADALRMVEQTAAKGKNIVMLSRDLARYFRDLLIIKADAKAQDYLHMPAQSMARARQIADSVTREVLVRVLGIFIGLDTSMRYAANPRTLLENAIANATTLQGLELGDLVAKLARLEQQVEKCNRDIREGVRVSVNDAAVQAQQGVVDKGDEPDAAPDLAIADEAQDALFEDAQAPIATMPTDAMSNTAVAVQYRSALAVELTKRKYMMLGTMVTTSFVTIEGNNVTFAFANENDKVYFEGNKEVIAACSADLLPFKPNFSFVYRAHKQNSEDDLTNVINILGAKKVTKK